MMTVVTGASGHLGNNLVRALLQRGESVRALCLEDSSSLEGLECEVALADVRDADAMKRALADADMVYHLAALISINGGLNGAVHAINVVGVRNVMQSALENGVRRVVHCSSIHAFDLNATGGAIDEQTDRPRPGKQGAYDLSKAAGEVEVRKAIADGLDAVIVNPTGVIGPGDPRPSRMGRVFLMLAQRRMPALVNGGFDFVDVRDVVAGALAAAERGRTGENYILSGAWTSVRNLATIAQSVTGVRAPRFTVPMFLARIGAPFASLYGRIRKREPLFTSESLHALRANRDISHAKAAEQLGYQPRPLADTIADTYDWFEQAGMLSLSRGAG